MLAKNFLFTLNEKLKQMLEKSTTKEFLHFTSLVGYENRSVRITSIQDQDSRPSNCRLLSAVGLRNRGLSLCVDKPSLPLNDQSQDLGRRAVDLYWGGEFLLFMDEWNIKTPNPKCRLFLKNWPDHVLQKFNTLFLTRFRTYKIATPYQTKNDQ